MVKSIKTKVEEFKKGTSKSFFVAVQGEGERSADTSGEHEFVAAAVTARI